MTALKVIGIILLILFLIGLVRVGGIAEYSMDGLRVWIRAGLFRLRIIPGGKTDKKKPPKKKKQPKPPSTPQPQSPPEEPKKKKGGPLHLVKLYLPLVCEAAGELLHRIRIDTLYLDFISGAREAYNAAMTLGYTNIALGMLWPLIDQNFEVKDHRIRTGVDFEADSPTVYGKAAFSARIGQLVSFALRFGIKFLKLYLQDKKEQKAENTAENMTKEANS